MCVCVCMCVCAYRNHIIIISYWAAMNVFLLFYLYVHVCVFIVLFVHTCVQVTTPTMEDENKKNGDEMSARRSIAFSSKNALQLTLTKTSIGVFKNLMHVSLHAVHLIL